MIHRSSFIFCCAFAAAIAHAAPSDLLQSWQTEAKAQSSAFSGFSAQRGRTFYLSQPSDWSCSTCHTKNPSGMGRHAITKKPIQPLSPLANPARFSDSQKVDKWFRRNCKDVFKRECTAAEKGDLLTYLLSRGDQT